jgi:hypothetical protein
MCVGWAWGAAAMASALRARSQVVLSSAYTRAQNQLISGVAPDSQFQKFVFEGVFLDVRSSAVFGAFFFVGMFALAGLKAVAPKLTFLAIFGMIVMVSSQSSEFSGVVCRHFSSSLSSSSSEKKQMAMRRTRWRRWIGK